MTFRCECSRVLLLSVVSLTAVLGDVRVDGQSPGVRPYVAAARMPSMALNPWPADFNKDGKVDLVAGHAVSVSGGQPIGGELVLRLGNGDGTFGAEQVIDTPTMAAPLGAADFNGDGNPDVLALDMYLDSGERGPTRLDPARPRRRDVRGCRDSGRVRDHVGPALPVGPVHLRHRG